GAAGIAEMLVQSRSEQIILLPALPKAWKTGHIKGIKAHGNIEIGMSWEDEKLTKAIFSSPISQKLSVSYGGKTYEIHVVANKTVELNL
ncbi:MAG: glycoside hydrolase family 95 protein, partial [Bacteroidota bacterium]|nr:glycoside hydrolase family 95 protein [Bacteroidota bacterium]